MTQVEEIKQEIEKMLKCYQNSIQALEKDCYTNNVIANYLRLNAQTKIDVCREILDLINSHTKEEVGEKLEEAAKHYLYSDILYDDVYVGNPTEKDCIEMFKAGAEWQKEQMMAKAVDGEVGYWNIRGLSVNMDLPSKFEEGDKVKLITIKKD